MGEWIPKHRKGQRRSMPPAPPIEGHPPVSFTASWFYGAADEREGCPQQLRIAHLRLVKPRPNTEEELLERADEQEGIFRGKRMMITCQSLDPGLNGKPLAATLTLWPRRGPGARDGSRKLSVFDQVLERLYGEVPLPGFELSRLLGENFMAVVERSRVRYIHGTPHPQAIVLWRTIFSMYDDWPKYPPTYTSYDRERIFVPGELAGALL